MANQDASLVLLPPDVLVGVCEYLLATDLTALRATCSAVPGEILCRAAEVILERRYLFKGRLPADALKAPGRVLLALHTAELRYICRLLCGPEPVVGLNQVVSPPTPELTLSRRLFREEDAESLHSDASSELHAAQSGRLDSDGSSSLSSASIATSDSSYAAEMATPHRAFSSADFRGSSLSIEDTAAPEAFWVSKNWIKNFIKFSERQEMRARELAASSKKGRHLRKTPKTKKLRSGSVSSASGERVTKKERLRERRMADVEKPWKDINADIRCRHGHLAVKSSGRARRRAVTPEIWKKLCLYYPESARSEFSVNTQECGLCSAQQERTGCGDCDHATMLTLMHRMYEIQSETMSALLHRKKGFPTMQQRRQRSVGTSAAARCPLQPGEYVLLPRAWMLSWRRYLRDPKAPKPEPFDLHESPLMCAEHRKIMAPPNFASFMRGDSRTPLSVSGEAESEEVRGVFPCEILGADEYQELNEWYPASAVPTFRVENGSWRFVGKVPGCSCCRAGYSLSVAAAIQEDMVSRRRSNAF